MFYCWTKSPKSSVVLIFISLMAKDLSFYKKKNVLSIWTCLKNCAMFVHSLIWFFFCYVNFGFFKRSGCRSLVGWLTSWGPPHLLLSPHAASFTVWRADLMHSESAALCRESPVEKAFAVSSLEVFILLRQLMSDFNGFELFWVSFCTSER